MKTSPPFFLVSFALCSSSVSADIWAEREALEQIKHEISAIEVLVESARMLSNPTDRTTFDYSSLLDDMKKTISTLTTTFVTLLTFSVAQVHAALPATADPTNAAADGDYIGLLKGYGFDIAIALGLFLGTIAFLAVAKNMVAVYTEIGAGKKWKTASEPVCRSHLEPQMVGESMAHAVIRLCV